jgi:hypothetical protein
MKMTLLQGVNKLDKFKPAAIDLELSRFLPHLLLETPDTTGSCKYF